MFTDDTPQEAASEEKLCRRVGERRKPSVNVCKSRVPRCLRSVEEWNHSKNECITLLQGVGGSRGCAEMQTLCVQVMRDVCK